MNTMSEPDFTTLTNVQLRQRLSTWANARARRLEKGLRTGTIQKACGVSGTLLLREAAERLAKAEKALQAAYVIYEAECKDWINTADPSDPEEALPPWQGRWVEFAKHLPPGIIDPEQA
jgi:hypothetical protein